MDASTTSSLVVFTPKSNLRKCFLAEVVDNNQPDQSLVDQVGWREAEQELCCVGCLLLLPLLVVQLLLLLIFGNLLLGVLGDALEWVAQVDGEERAKREEVRHIFSPKPSLVQIIHLLTREGALISDPCPSPT